VKGPQGLRRCVRCSCEWSPGGAAERARCPGCASWNSIPRPSSWIPLVILLVVALMTCYFLVHPQDLARLMGL
jgi:hypothetical protein